MANSSIPTDILEELQATMGQPLPEAAKERMAYWKQLRQEHPALASQLLAYIRPSRSDLVSSAVEQERVRVHRKEHWYSLLRGFLFQENLASENVPNRKRWVLLGTIAFVAMVGISAVLYSTKPKTDVKLGSPVAAAASSVLPKDNPAATQDPALPDQQLQGQTPTSRSPGSAVSSKSAEAVPSSLIPNPLKQSAQEAQSSSPSNQPSVGPAPLVDWSPPAPSSGTGQVYAQPQYVPRAISGNNAYLISPNLPPNSDRTSSAPKLSTRSNPQAGGNRYVPQTSAPWNLGMSSSGPASISTPPLYADGKPPVPGPPGMQGSGAIQTPLTGNDQSQRLNSADLQMPLSGRGEDPLVMTRLASYGQAAKDTPDGLLSSPQSNSPKPQQPEVTSLTQQPRASDLQKPEVVAAQKSQAASGAQKSQAASGAQKSEAASSAQKSEAASGVQKPNPYVSQKEIASMVQNSVAGVDERSSEPWQASRPQSEMALQMLQDQKGSVAALTPVENQAVHISAPSTPQPEIVQRLTTAEPLTTRPNSPSVNASNAPKSEIASNAPKSEIASNAPKSEIASNAQRADVASVAQVTGQPSGDNSPIIALSNTQGKPATTAVGANDREGVWIASRQPLVREGVAATNRSAVDVFANQPFEPKAGTADSSVAVPFLAQRLPPAKSAGATNPGPVDTQTPVKPQSSSLAANPTSPANPNLLTAPPDGTLLEATLLTSIVTAEGASVPVIAQSAEGNWIGTASLSPLGRVLIRFHQLVSAGGSIKIIASAFDPEGVPGVGATLEDQSPALAADLLRAGVNGFSTFAQSLLQAGNTVVTGGVVIKEQKVPLLEYILGGEIAKLFQLPSTHQSVVRVARVPKGSPILVAVGVLVEGSTGR